MGTALTIVLAILLLALCFFLAYLFYRAALVFWNAPPTNPNDTIVQIGAALLHISATLMASIMDWFIKAMAILCFIIAILLPIGCIRSCVRQTEEPTVRIEGAGPLLLANESAMRSSQVLVLTAVGQPAGGSYHWTIVEGQGKVAPQSGFDDPEFWLKPTGADQQRDDVVVEVSYTVDGNTVTATVPLTVHQPAGYELLDTIQIDYAGPAEFGYEVTATYQILDQFGDPFPKAWSNVDEVVEIIADPFAVNHTTNNWTADANAQFPDTYWVIQSTPLPSNFLMIMWQTYVVDGFEIGAQEVEYGPSGVEIRQLW